MKLTHEQAIQVLKWIDTRRLSNYGYPDKEFMKLSRQASSLRVWFREPQNRQLAIRYLMKNGVDNIMNGRLTFREGKPFYVVGQSFNEEYIYFMEALKNKIQLQAFQL